MVGLDLSLDCRAARPGRSSASTCPSSTSRRTHLHGTVWATHTPAWNLVGHTASLDDQLRTRGAGKGSMQAACVCLVLHAVMGKPASLETSHVGHVSDTFVACRMGALSSRRLSHASGEAWNVQLCVVPAASAVPRPISKLACMCDDWVTAQRARVHAMPTPTRRNAHVKRTWKTVSARAYLIRGMARRCKLAQLQRRCQVLRRWPGVGVGVGAWKTGEAKTYQLRMRAGTTSYRFSFVGCWLSQVEILKMLYAELSTFRP